MKSLKNLISVTRPVAGIVIGLTLTVVIGLTSSCGRKEVRILPSDYVTHDRSEYPSIPPGYMVISITKYNQMVRREIECEAVLVNCE